MGGRDTQHQPQCHLRCAVRPSTSPFLPPGHSGRTGLHKPLMERQNPEGSAPKSGLAGAPGLLGGGPTPSGPERGHSEPRRQPRESPEHEGKAERAHPRPPRKKVDSSAQKGSLQSL